MSNVNKRVIAVLAAVFVAVTAAVFAIPFPKGATFWVAYIAEVVAIGLQFIVFKTAFPSGTELKSKVLGFPVARVGIIYLVVQSIVSTVFFIVGAFFPSGAVGYCIAVCVIILAAAFVFGVITDSARNVVQQVENDIKKETPAMRQLIAESRALCSMTNDPALKGQLEKLAEKFRFSDPVSSPELQAIEDELLQQLSELRADVRAGGETAASRIASIEQMLDERNIMCKNYKS